MSSIFWRIGSIDTTFGTHSNLEHRAPVLTDDEVGRLADQFNEMVEQLKRSRNQSEAYSRSLEEQTQALQAALQEVRTTQAQLIQSEKMSSLGQLVAGVAHEINNLVNFIYGNLKPLENYVQDLITIVQAYQRLYPQNLPELQAMLDAIEFDYLIKDVVEVLTSINAGAERIRAIVLSLRNFSRLDEAEYKAVDLHEGIESTLLLLQHRLQATETRSEIQVHKSYGDLPLVECYAGQINQVLMNLLSNAIDAIEAANQTIRRKNRSNRISIQTSVNVNRAIEIRIADNGIGISEDLRSRIFDPFFTTKPVGAGTGLGLAISYQIVTGNHRGKLLCDSTPGEGTQLILEIPAKVVHDC
ncbi:HAMP domain-containing protein [Pseudanabaenaceae cyanobacterium LEGE 13415]|nr:HAMP domain-containing protein [Pseudanabaenaceae cyanobacterium LEGE 13415]